MINGTHELAVYLSFLNVIIAIGLLSEYIKSEEEYDKMELVVGVARGVAYLHCELSLVLPSILRVGINIFFLSKRNCSFGYTRGMFNQEL
jgi:hypothetical protein